MAKFSENSTPTEFLGVLRQLTLEIEEKTSVVAKEKQLIDSLEKEICSKREDTKRMQADNAELANAIKHTNNIFENLQEQLKMFTSSGELLKQQVKLKEDMLLIQQEKNKKLLDDCEAKYSEYLEKLDDRLHKYSTFPFVAELKKEMSEVNDIKENTRLKIQELNSLQSDLDKARSRRDISTLEFQSITEWGVALAKRMQKIAEVKQTNSEKLKETKFLLQEIDKLKLQKRAIEMKQSRDKEAIETSKKPTSSDSRQHQDYTRDGQEMLTESSQTVDSRWKSRLVKMPSFDQFLKRKPNVLQRSGASGSSLRSSALSSSLPSIPGMLASSRKPDDARAREAPAIRTQVKASSANSGTKTVSSTNSQLFQRSKSLSFLVPQVKPFKKTEAIKTSGSMLGKSLSDWLNPLPVKAKSLEVIQEKMEIVDDKPAESRELLVVSPKKQESPTKRKLPHPVVHLTADHKTTEVPLIRQIQEKIMQKKAIEHGDQLLQERNLANEPVAMVVEEEVVPARTEISHKQPENLLSLFDGPTYDVPMPSEEDDFRPEASSPVKSSPDRTSEEHTPQTTPKGNLSIFEEHERLMIELKKSPEFLMTSNMMPTGGADGTNLMSPGSLTAPDPGSQHAPEGSHRFVVPQQPSPGLKPQSPSGPFAFNFADSGSSPVDAADSSFGFGFFGSGEKASSGFGFGSNATGDRAASAPTSPFSFSFGSKASSPSPDASNPFAFNLGNSTGQGSKSSDSGFSFGSAAKSPETSSGTFFSSIFGCK